MTQSDYQNKEQKTPINDERFWEEIKFENKLKAKKQLLKNDDFKKLVSVYEDSMKSFRQIEVGQIVKCKIEKISDSDIIASCDFKDNIFIDTKDKKYLTDVEIGDYVEVLITAIINNPYQIKGSMSEIVKLNINEKLKQYFIDSTPLSGVVKEKISAGFLIDVLLDGMTINTFMPNIIASVNRLTEEETDKLVGQNVEVCLETLQQDRGLYVVSRKKYLQKHQFEDELVKIDKTKEYTGRVTGTTPFGIFVQFSNCLTGMIHKANLSDDMKNNIHEDGKFNIKPGTEIKFYVKDVVKNGKQIILTQILRESIIDTVKPGNEFTATVFSIKKHGMLVSLDYETLALIQNPYIQRKNKTFNVGDKIQVKVISVIKEDRKIYLDLV
jgi:ribosomal protein S1